MSSPRDIYIRKYFLALLIIPEHSSRQTRRFVAFFSEHVPGLSCCADPLMLTSSHLFSSNPISSNPTHHSRGGSTLLPSCNLPWSQFFSNIQNLCFLKSSRFPPLFLYCIYYILSAMVAIVYVMHLPNCAFRPGEIPAPLFSIKVEYLTCCLSVHIKVSLYM